MLDSRECWLQDTCKKFKRDSSCSTNDTFCIKQFKLDKLYDLSLLSDKQKKHIKLWAEANGTDRKEFTKLKEIEENIDSFVKNGNNLYLYSHTCGNGKTAWSTRLIQSYLENNWYNCDLKCIALFIHVPKYLLAIKQNISEKSEYVEFINKNIFSADVVVFDEIATKIATPFEHENLLNIINNRITDGKSNIYTSNLSPVELKENLGERLFSRIISLSQIIELKGKDKRGSIRRKEED